MRITNTRGLIRFSNCAGFSKLYNDSDESNIDTCENDEIIISSLTESEI